MTETIENTKKQKTPDDILASIRQRKMESNIERERYGTPEEQTETITTMLMTELVGRYRRKLQERYDRYDDEYIGNWFGLRQIKADTLDDETRTHKYVFQMDADLCEILNMPKLTAFYVIGINFKMIKLHIPGFNHRVPELDRIRRLLETVIPVFVMKNEE
jgi:hypothetical protein